MIADDASQIRPAMAGEYQRKEIKRMIENNKFFTMLPELYEIVVQLPEQEQRKLANVGTGILLARGEKDGR